jgi:UDP-N-acetylglucosamine--N-acetylmuramyl-(pentapeptide) pyrophosphoryl-undecaprenol N-acetylglucosamine transferase
MNVVIACGGTGGHLFPGLAVAEVLRDRGHEILLLISEKQIDATAVRERSEFKVEKIPSIGMPKLASAQLFPFVGKFLQGFLACQKIYRSFHPDAVLGMGGFTSTGPILAGRIAGVPTFIHESNAIPGKANRLNARLSEKVLLGFQECRKFFPKSEVAITGTPIRSSLRSRIDRERALENLRLKPALKTVLVMGGSQGAHGINEALGASLPHFTAKPVQFIHLTGKEDEDEVYERYKKEGIPAFVSAFYGRMEEVYTVADVAVARSGAASLTELSYFGLPSILIPYPYAAENHQQLNAKIFANNCAAEMMEESKATGDALAHLIDGLLSDPVKTNGMRSRLRALAPENSAPKIADLVERSRR